MQISSAVGTVFFLCISCMKEGDVLGKTTGILNYRQRVKEFHLKRSRFIQSRIDSRSMGSGAGYDELPDLYLIFVTEKDFLNVRTGITRIVRIIKGTDRQIENGVHEIYANLEYPAEDEEITRLL